MVSEFNRRIAIARLINMLSEEENIPRNEIFDTIICIHENLDRVKSLVSGDKVQSDFEFLILKQLYYTAEKIPTKEGTLFAHEKLLKKLGGKKDTVLRLVRQFVTGHADSCALIIEFVKNRDFTGARGVIHDVIGITGNLCCDRLYNAASELRIELHAEKADSLEVFRTLWNETMDALNIFLKLNDPDVEAAASEKPFKNIWERFIELCREFDIQSVDYFYKHSGEFAKTFGEREFDRIETALNRYDLDWIVQNVKYTGE